MKKFLMLAGVLALIGGVSFAAPSPELLESLTTQILEQQTKTKSAKEVLDQLKPLFTQCAKSHKDQAVQSVCKSFLEKQFVSIEKKWQEIQIGGLSVFRVGKLKNKERLAYFGLDDIANYSLEKHRLPLNQLDYLVVNMPEFSLSFFVPALSEETTLSKDYGLTFKCENLKKHRKESINKMKKDFPNSVGQVLDEED